ncbi:MAG: hypothetical protein GC136_03720 [Alphaproteobacteria bacterium]|nr:hypothetical protein [Alphaproteobacteria bacterium]
MKQLKDFPLGAVIRTVDGNFGIVKQQWVWSSDDKSGWELDVAGVIKGEPMECRFGPEQIELDDQSKYAGYNMDGTMPPNATFEKTGPDGEGRRLVINCAWAPGVK